MQYQDAKETHYDVLEVDPGASPEEIRRAYRRAQRIYSKESLAVYSLFTEEDLEVVRRKIDEAYEAVAHPEKRQTYNRTLNLQSRPLPKTRPSLSVVRQEGPLRARVLPPRLPQEQTEADELIEALSLDETIIYDGPTLRKIREARGFDLRDISVKTKIGITLLSAIEEDAYSSLVHPVYIKGHVAEIAKMLGLCPERVAHSYLSLYRAYLRSKNRHG